MQKSNSQGALEQPWGDLWERLGRNRLLLIGMIGIAVLLAVQLLLPQPVGQPSPTAVPVTSSVPQDQVLAQIISYKQGLEQQLSSTLSEMQGVGKVTVTLSLESGPEVVPAINLDKSERTTEEKDANNGTRVTKEQTQSSTMVTNSNSNGVITLKEKLPVISGVVVVAQGADSPSIQLAIMRAVQASLNIPFHKIVVYPGK